MSHNHNTERKQKETNNRRREVKKMSVDTGEGKRNIRSREDLSLVIGFTPYPSWIELPKITNGAAKPVHCEQCMTDDVYHA